MRMMDYHIHTKYSPDSKMFPEMFDKILRKIIDNGKGIEINTSGLNRAGHVLPHPSIIKRYGELGGKIITIGSDAHTPERIGEHVEKTIELVRKCGFKEIAVYEHRILEFLVI